jgi:hypothetical protein
VTEKEIWQAIRGKRKPVNKVKKAKKIVPAKKVRRVGGGYTKVAEKSAMTKRQQVRPSTSAGRWRWQSVRTGSADVDVDRGCLRLQGIGTQRRSIIQRVEALTVVTGMTESGLMVSRTTQQ